MLTLLIPSVLVALSLTCSIAAEDDAKAPCGEGNPVVFRMDFTEVPPGAPPSELLILDGAFQVREEGEEKFLELAGTPLDSFAVLFGPRVVDGLSVEARIRAQSTRRLAPRFGIGLGGLGGYRLRVVPARGEIELVLNEKLIAAAPYEWKTGTWTNLELQLETSGETQWTVRGRAWPSDQPRPDGWSINHTTTETPLPGQPSVWGTPYSSRPIQFDDLVVRKLTLDAAP